MLAEKKTCNERGVALLTVLLATALVAIVAVSMTSAQQINIRRTTSLIDGDQAMLMAQGLEEWGCNSSSKTEMKATMTTSEKTGPWV